jgi:hypothetical protein
MQEKQSTNALMQLNEWRQIHTLTAHLLFFEFRRLPNLVWECTLSPNILRTRDRQPLVAAARQKQLAKQLVAKRFLEEEERYGWQLLAEKACQEEERYGYQLLAEKACQEEEEEGKVQRNYNYAAYNENPSLLSANAEIKSAEIRESKENKEHVQKIQQFLKEMRPMMDGIGVTDIKYHLKQVQAREPSRKIKAAIRASAEGREEDIYDVWRYHQLRSCLWLMKLFSE